MSLEQLNTWLNTLEPEAKVDGTSMLDGYLTAIVIGPRSIPPDEWFVDLLGEHGHIATASGMTLAAVTAIVGRFNAISEGLSAAPEQHAPIFEKADDGTVLPHPWCMGFLAAMRLRFEAWRPLRDLNRIEHGLLLPILPIASTRSVGRCLDRRARGRKPRRSCAPPTTTSRPSYRRSGRSGCRSGCARRKVKPEPWWCRRVGYA
jgi:uncharacterized protein